MSRLRATVWEAWVTWTLFATAWTYSWREMPADEEPADEEPLVAAPESALSKARTVSSTRWRGPRVKTLVDAETAADAVALVRVYAGTHAGGTDELLSTMLQLFFIFPPTQRQVRAMTRVVELGGKGGLEDFCACTVLMGMFAAADELTKPGAPRPPLPGMARARSFG